MSRCKRTNLAKSLQPDRGELGDGKHLLCNEWTAQSKYPAEYICKGKQEMETAPLILQVAAHV